MKDLIELIPERVEWKPRFEDDEGQAQELEFIFRPFNLEDESWLGREYPGQRMFEVFRDFEMKEIQRIAFHQLSTNSKRDLMKITFIQVDENGCENETAKTGPEKIGMLVAGEPGKVELIQMILRTRGISTPIFDEIAEGIESGKLNPLLRKMGMEEVIVSPIGEKSLT